jgi:hypothetical protein
MGPPNWVYKLLRWGLAGVFVYAGTAKMLDPATFAVLIDAYGIVPDLLLMPVAVGLPLLEVAAGVGLLFDVEGSLGVVAVLLALFAALMGYGLRLGLDIDCGCFGPGDPEGEAFHGLRTTLYRDLALLASTGILYALRRILGIRPSPLRFRSGGRKPEEPGGVADPQPAGGENP